MTHRTLDSRDARSRWPWRLMSCCRVASVALAATIMPGRVSGQVEDTLLHAPIRTGEAVVWYLYHSGWAIRTASHLLIFDYAPSFRGGTPGDLEDGWISPEQIGDLRVVAFISHAPSDHFDPSILRATTTTVGGSLSRSSGTTSST